MLKRLFGLVVIAALASVVLTTGLATANPGNGATVTRFSVTYPDDLATCSGNRIEHPGGRNAFIKDVETCVTVIDFYAPGTYSVTDPLVEWCSDFDGFAECNPATSGTLTVSADGDGTFTWSIVAYYAKH